MKNQSIYAALLLLMLSSLGLYGILLTPPPIEEDIISPMALPWLALGACVFCAILIFIQGLFSKKNNNIPKDIQPFIKTLAYSAFFGLYLMSMIALGNFFSNSNTFIVSYGGGFCITTTFFLALSMYIMKYRKYKMLSIVSLLAVGILLLVFGSFFNIMLP